jgi:hypothetical protein
VHETSNAVHPKKTWDANELAKGLIDVAGHHDSCHTHAPWISRIEIARPAQTVHERDRFAARSP